MSAKTKDRCPSCKKEWIDHLGPIHLCRKLEQANTALKIMATWASVPGALVPDDVLKLTEETLKATE